MPRQIGLSPKVLGQLVTAVIVWVLAHYAISVPADIEAAIAALAGAIAGYTLPAGAVAHDWPASSSDELLARQVADDPAAPRDGT